MVVAIILSSLSLTLPLILRIQNFPVLPIAIFISIATLFYLIITNRLSTFTPKWLKICFIVILINSLLCFDISIIFILGIMIVYYLIGNSMGVKIFYSLIPFIILESILVIIEGGESYSEGLTTNAHITSILLVIGTFMIPSNIKYLLLPLVLPALILSGSEEGLLALLAIGLGSLNFKLILVSTIIILISTFLLTNIYPNLNSDRITDLNTILNGRESALKSTDIYIIGEGWKFDTHKGAIHNVPLLIANNIGIIASITYISIGIIYYTKKPRYRGVICAVFIYCMFDHMFWTFLFPWPAFLIGSTINENNTKNQINIKT